MLTPRSKPFFALLTDFGISDTYVAQMKGVLLNLCANATIIDISHAVRPFDIDHGRFLLKQAVPYMPKTTIFLVVIDPTVGSERKGIVLEAGGHFFVGPDNGLFSDFLRGATSCHEIVLPSVDRNSDTFHGRDVFAACAAHLANGYPIDKIGRSINSGDLMSARYKPAQAAVVKEGMLVAPLIHIDHYGNLLFNVTRSEIDALGDLNDISIKLEDIEIQGVSSCFADVECGAWLAYFGSSGVLEIARNQKSAALHFVDLTQLVICVELS